MPTTPGLRARVAALLDAHSQDFLEAAPTLAAGPHAHHQREHVEGRVIGPYIIRREIGRGGMGIVYLADDTRLSRRVALKALSPGLGREFGGRERLRLEARAAAALQLLVALAIGGAHPEFAMLFVTVATATLVASFVIEPATAKVAFGGGAPAPSASSRA